MESTSTSAERQSGETGACRVGRALRANVWSLVCGSALGACTPSTTAVTTTNVDDAFEVRLAVYEALGSLAGPSFDEALEPFASDVLHEGQGRDAVAGWVRGVRATIAPSRYLRAVADDLEIRVEQVEASSGDPGTTARASVRFHLTLSECAARLDAGAGQDPDAALSPACTFLEDRVVRPFAPGAWLAHVRKRDGRWMFVGDGRPVTATILSDHAAGALSLVVRVADPMLTATAMSLRGPGVVETPLRQTAAGQWAPATPLVLAATLDAFPTPPLEYGLLVERAGSSVQYRYTVDRIVREFATAVSPTGEATIPPRFAWVANSPSLAPRFRVRLFDDDALLWLSRDVFETSVEYQGPTLVGGRSYRYEIAWLDGDDNQSRNSQSFIAVEASTLTPAILAVTPAVGSIGGGQSGIVTGGNFRSGTQVLFGVAAATSVAVSSPTSLQCLTPPGAAGPVNVTVLDPSGRVGVLRSGYVYTAQ